MAAHAALNATRSTVRKPAEMRTPTRRLVADRLARVAVTGGGLAIIASILGILIFVLLEVWPLVVGASVTPGPAVGVAGLTRGAALSDPYGTHVAVAAPDGLVRVVRMSDGGIVAERPIVADPAALPLREVRIAAGQQVFTALAADARVLALPVAWAVSFSGSTRVVTPHLGAPISFELTASPSDVAAWTVRVNEDGEGTAAVQLTDGSLQVVGRRVTRNLLSGEVTESWERFEGTSAPRLETLIMDRAQRNLFAGSATGRLSWWELAGGTLRPARVLEAPGPAVTALTLLLGDRSLVVGREGGELEVWFPVRRPDETFELTRIRDFPPHRAAIHAISPSLRDKGFLALDDAGGLGLYHSTSHRSLWTGPSPVPEPSSVFFTPKADGAVVAGADQVGLLAVRNPHPEVSLKALFGRVWYEGYGKPEYVWQSSGGTDDFEPKLSLAPLLVGTLKGTVYSLVLAIPLAVLGAMYTSQFMHATYKRYVKPTVEIMAALPSVVLGFMAGLWLAPRVEKVFPALVLMLVFLPLGSVATGLAWRALPRAIRGRFRMGAEAVLYMAVAAATLWACVRLGPLFEKIAFGGNFPDWLLEATGLRYDQRNAIVVGLAMGFAVIPIIFSIAEEAFSNVPRNLAAASLALGADRWQTVTRVVLPTASPGIFSGIMIGFGRAVGETMIVLMATGNTPIMDWNPFNGFRTLSANIAVEIPEAPHGGTLYRTLFLAALMLFVLTFAVNTCAEIVRHRLRRRYSQL
jgi:phosphate transport system permease protein